ncbi:MAG: esterase/lipase family protein [Acidobacteriota bacterium]
MAKVLVNVHGAGKAPSNFYAKGLKALTQILGAEPAQFPCWYADLCHPGGVRSLKPLPPEAEQARAALIEEMLQRRNDLERERSARTSPPPAEAGGAVTRGRASKTTRKATTGRATMTGGRATKGGAALTTGQARGLMDLPVAATDAASDVIRYLFDGKMQKSIRNRLAQALDQATAGDAEIILVSHSLGTVVAFDVLRELAGRYPIKRFVTMGSPLRKLATTGIHPVDLGAITTQTIPFWRNLYDNTDLVADAIGPAFPAYPIEDVFIQVADLPIPSHNYWENLQVQKMIADWLR